VVERSLGAILILTGVVMATNLDIRFENTLANSSLPSFLVDPTRSLENSGAVQNRLASLRPPSKFLTRQREASATPVSVSAGVGIPGVRTPSLPDLGSAPEFTDNQRWFNTPGGRPLTLAGLRGHVVLVDFWTYTCINCLRTLPFLKGLYATYHPYGFDVVGVETPEFTFEQNASNVQQAIASDGLRYPVVQDNNYGTWNAYHNEYWPAEYLIDAHGQVRHVQFGEGDYGQSQVAVRELLYQSGVHNLPPPSGAHAIMPSLQLGTAETYLGAARAQGFVQKPKVGVRYYARPGYIQPNQFALAGIWKVTNQSVTPVSSGATVQGRFLAAHAYLVMTSAGNRPRTVRVLLDGRPISSSAAGADVHGGLVTVRGQRLYSLVSLSSDQPHILELEIPPGVSAYDFTFG
jgi:thiol-disulfide isomerase/thioredoxin